METLLMPILLMVQNQLAIMEALSVIHRDPELTTQIARTKIFLETGKRVASENSLVESVMTVYRKED